jgi:cobalt/nickel transport system ATP-binding protein
MNSSDLFELDTASFAYPGMGPSLDSISFAVRPGERLALLGANGSGKSTLLNILDGLYFATSGRARAFGTALTEESIDHPPLGPRFRREVGFLFQNSDAQLFCPTVEDELAFGPLQLGGLSAEDIQGRTDDTLALLEIPHLKRRAPQTLSAGEKKLVALASLLVLGPSVLLLDEPTAGLDPRSQSILLDVLGELHEAGLTLITATQDLTLLPHLADRAIVLTEDHRIAADLPVESVLEDTGLLLAVNLIHVHSHRHGTLLHTHPHQHVIAHDHSHPC